MYRGAMDDVTTTIQALAHRIDANGCCSVGHDRKPGIELGEHRVRG